MTHVADGAARIVVVLEYKADFARPVVYHEDPVEHLLNLSKKLLYAPSLEELPPVGVVSPPVDDEQVLVGGLLNLVLHHRVAHGLGHHADHCTEVGLRLHHPRKGAYAAVACIEVPDVAHDRAIWYAIAGEVEVYFRIECRDEFLFVTHALDDLPSCFVIQQGQPLYPQATSNQVVQL